ncbi:MAG: serine dehydratase beta chain, partial [Aureliella sp.]
MISLFELFKIGIGPSSSHTVGPMLAAKQFADELAHASTPDHVSRITIELFGSLALTGLGHSTDRAVLLGLMGQHPRTVDPASIEPRFAEVTGQHSLRWLDRYPIQFDPRRDLIFHRDRSLTRHPNGLQFTAYDAQGAQLLERRYYSVGGG